jgi:hypothetical protein
LNGDKLSVANCSIRALEFGERARALELARSSVTPATTLRTAIRQLAIEGAPTAIVDAIALHLAGGSITDAPSFAETIVRVARGTGWSPDQLDRCPAVDVDRLAIAMSTARAADASEWKRFELLRDAPSTAEALVDELCERLLSRTANVKGDLPEQPSAALQTPRHITGSTTTVERSTSSVTSDGSAASPWMLAPSRPDAVSSVPLAPLLAARRASSRLALSGYAVPSADARAAGAPSTVASTTRASDGTSVPIERGEPFTDINEPATSVPTPMSWKARAIPSFGAMPPTPSATPSDVEDLARSLEDECDLRGIAR